MEKQDPIQKDSNEKELSQESVVIKKDPIQKDVHRKLVAIKQDSMHPNVKSEHVVRFHAKFKHY